ncbi:MAG: hypothetical protein J7L07_02940 [Candidatus Odinarchaeota archaeon]|nr:hypothetical protein [Candidatus Odinarchaeota archaeon]
MRPFPCQLREFFATDPRELKDLRSMFQDLGDYIFGLIPRLEVGTAVITGTMDVLRHSLYIKIPEERRTTHGGYSLNLIERC